MPRPASTDSEDSAANKKKILLARVKNKAPDEEEQMLARDNLKIKTIAKYKTIMAGDINMYTDIEN